MAYSKKYFGTDGIRGRCGIYPLTPEFVLKLGWAAGKVLAKQGTKKVVIGKDTRISGYLFEAALEAGLISAGLGVAFTGPLPTPAIAYLTKTFRADAGIVISASHNPYYDNGIKFFSSKGEKLSDEIECEIEAMLDEPMDCVASELLGKVRRINDAQGRYIEFCKSTFPSDMSLEGLRIVLDCAHGATYDIAPKVFRELGADVIEIGTSPNGININDKAGAIAPQWLSQKVVATGADLGLAFDGDGDRLMMVDRTGAVLDGDQLIYLITKARMLTGTLVGGVVGTTMSNRALENAFKRLGVAFERADVGDRYIVEQLKTNGWILGAENSGHILLLDKNSTGDGIIAGLEVLSGMKASGRDLSDLRKEIVLYPQELINVQFSAEHNPLEHQQVIDLTAEIEQQLGESGRVLLRKSGTEPVIRVMVEAQDGEKAKEYANILAQTIESIGAMA